MWLMQKNVYTKSNVHVSSICASLAKLIWTQKARSTCINEWNFAYWVRPSKSKDQAVFMCPKENHSKKEKNVRFVWRKAMHFGSPGHAQKKRKRLCAYETTAATVCALLAHRPSNWDQNKASEKMSNLLLWIIVGCRTFNSVHHSFQVDQSLRGTFWASFQVRVAPLRQAVAPHTGDAEEAFPRKRSPANCHSWQPGCQDHPSNVAKNIQKEELGQSRSPRSSLCDKQKWSTINFPTSTRQQGNSFPMAFCCQLPPAPFSPSSTETLDGDQDESGKLCAQSQILQLSVAHRAWR